MPVKNCQKSLLASVKSILDQDFCYFELLILDNGSKDGTIELCQSIRDSRVRFFVFPELSLPRLLNQGISLSRGKYIARMDGDDLALPGRLEQQCTYLDKNKEIMVLGSNAYFRNSSTESIDQCQAGYASRLPTTSIDIRWHSLFNCPFIHPSTILRKQLIQTLGGYPLWAMHCEDYALWSNIVHKYNAANTNMPFLIYTLPGPSLSDSVASKRNLQLLGHDCIMYNQLKLYCLNFEIDFDTVALLRILLVTPEFKNYEPSSRSEFQKRLSKAFMLLSTVYKTFVAINGESKAISHDYEAKLSILRSKI